jgi:hypothetical protein
VAGEPPGIPRVLLNESVFNEREGIQMRILATVTLSASLMIAAPVFAGFDSQPSIKNTPSTNETVVLKTSPDGTWPFAINEEQTPQVISYSI